jgi:hypothetical protein
MLLLLKTSQIGSSHAYPISSTLGSLLRFTVAGMLDVPLQSAHKRAVRFSFDLFIKNSLKVIDSTSQELYINPCLTTGRREISPALE